MDVSLILFAVVLSPLCVWGAALLETAPQPAHLTVHNDMLFWSETGDTPVKKISLLDGKITPLAAKIGVPANIALRGQYVYWIDERTGISPSGACTGTGVIWSLQKTSLESGSTTTLATGDNCADGTNDILVDDTNVYWVTSVSSPNTYSIQRVPIAGGSAITIATSINAPVMALASDGTYLYWQAGRYPDPGVIKKMALSGGVPTEVYADPDGTSGDLRSMSSGLAIQGANLFFADRGSPNKYRVLKVPVSGGPPTVLFSIEINDSVQNWVKAMTVDDEYVFWLDNDSLKSVPMNGGNSSVLASILESPLDIAVTGGKVYWTETTGPAHRESGTVKRVLATGGPAEVVVQGGDAPRQLAFDAQYIYWTEGGPIGLIEGFGRIVRTPLAGGAITAVVSGVSSNSPPLAVDATHVYIADGWRIKKVPMAGGRIDTIAAADEEIAGLATDGSFVYWIDRFARIAKTPVDGGAITFLSTALSGPPGPIRALDGFVYWMDDFETINKVPTSGGQSIPVATDLPFLNDFVVDGDFVYFSENDTGAIKKVSVNGGSPTTLTTRPAISSPRYLTVDSQYLYWIDQSEVGKIPIAGGPLSFVETDLESDPFLPNTIVVDNTDLYWTEMASGAIRTTRTLQNNSAGYFPLAAGNSWTYLENGTDSMTVTVLQDPETVNNVNTTVVEDSDGSREYFTNDTNGIRLHREYYPSLFVQDVGNVESSVTFSPPIVYAEPVMTLGQPVHSSGTALFTFAGLVPPSVTLNYEAESVAEGFETISLDLGVFRAGKVKTTIQFHGSIGGQEFEMLLIRTNWLADKLGPVQWEDSDGDVTDTAVLTATNIPMADLAVTKTDSLDPVVGRQELTYTVDVINNGPDDATGIVLTDLLPAGVEFVSASPTCTNSNGMVNCTIANLPSGGETTVTITVVPDVDQTMRNQVTVEGNEVDPNWANNSSSAMTEVIIDTDGDGCRDSIEVAGGRDPDRQDPYGDLNGDCILDLKDVVLVLQLLARIGPNATIYLVADVNGDGFISLAEAIFVLQKITGLR
jgi:uncharacterized repeat protein (TIGR01451 family)